MLFVSNSLSFGNDLYHVLIVNPDSQVAVQLHREDEQRQEGGRAAEGHVSQKGCRFARFCKETRSWLEFQSEIVVLLLCKERRARFHYGVASYKV